MIRVPSVPICGSIYYMSLAISVENVSKRYRLGEISRLQLLGDIHRWWMKRWARKSHARNHSAVPEPEEKGDFWALKDISFDLEQGETIAIVGANGAGKSTLLKIISRITAPTTGLVRIRGRIGTLLEVGTGFHPELTGRDNVFLNGAILGMSRNEVKRKFDDIVSFAGLEQFIDTPVKRYSSGMYVRLAFSVAAFLEPEILIIDEVLSVGDAAVSNPMHAANGANHQGRQNPHLRLPWGRRRSTSLPQSDLPPEGQNHVRWRHRRRSGRLREVFATGCLAMCKSKPRPASPPDPKMLFPEWCSAESSPGIDCSLLVAAHLVFASMRPISLKRTTDPECSESPKT